jgi:hypothetical protein
LNPANHANVKVINFNLNIQAGCVVRDMWYLNIFMLAGKDFAEIRITTNE